MPFVTIIPSKDIRNLQSCVTAVRKHEPDARIIVIDDGLEPLEIMQRGEPWRCEFEVLPGKKPFIFARNVNMGIRAAGQRDVVILNDDALLESPRGFSLLEAECRNHPDYGMIGATTNITGQPLQRRRNVGLRQVPDLAFICVYIPRRTIDHLAELGKTDDRFGHGMLDERYRIDYGVEDRDYCEAVTRAGLKCGVHDACYVDHGSLHSSFRGAPRAPRSFQKNLALFKEKWSGK